MEKENYTKGIDKQLKKQMGWKESGPPSALRLDNQIVRKPEMIANVQQDFYSTKINKLNDKLPDTGPDPLYILKAALTRWGHKTGKIKKLTLQPVGIETHFDFFLMGNSTAFEYDGIDQISLKMVANEIAIPINFIINLSITSSTFPTKWKIGRLIPLFKGKGKDPLDPESFRPV